jgi:hypothetical protein
MSKYTGTLLATNNSIEEIRKADLDLLAKINQAFFDFAAADDEINRRIDGVDSRINGLNVPSIVTDGTYGRYRAYPDGSTQGRTLTASVVESAALALTTNIVRNVVSLVVPAGSWVFSFFARILEEAATTHAATAAAVIAVSKTSATLPAADTGSVPTDGELREVHRPGNATVNASWQFSGGAYRVDLLADTTFYLVARDTFAVSTASVYGWFQAISIL